MGKARIQRLSSKYFEPGSGNTVVSSSSSFSPQSKVANKAAFGTNGTAYLLARKYRLRRTQLWQTGCFCVCISQIPFNFNDALHMLSGKRSLLEFLVLLITPLTYPLPPPPFLYLQGQQATSDRLRPFSFLTYPKHFFSELWHLRGISPTSGRAQKRTF